MMNNWTRTEIEKIMIQLDERQLPFWGYELVRSETGLELVGQGGFALVYEARSRRSKRHRYVIKVIGFGNQYVNSDYFKSTAKVQMHLGIWGEDVVRVFDFAEYKIGLDEEDQVLDVWKLTGNPEKDTEKMHVLHLQFVVLADPYNVKYARLLFSGNRYWLFGCVFYLTMMLTGAALHLTDGHLLHLVMTDSMIAYLSQVDLTKAGGVGFLLCIVWMIRKQILIKGNIDALNYKR